MSARAAHSATTGAGNGAWLRSCAPQAAANAPSSAVPSVADLSELDLRRLRFALLEATRRRVLDGWPEPAWVPALDRKLRAMIDASMSRSGHGKASRAGQLKYDDDRIGVAEAAQLLGVSIRHARRIASDLDAERVSGRWLFRRRNVAEYANARNANGENDDDDTDTDRPGR